MGKQGVNARLVLRLREIELGGAVLLRDRVIRLDLDNPEWIPAPEYSVSDREVVTSIQNG